MARYKVLIAQTTWFSVIVDASSEPEAEKKALDGESSWLEFDQDESIEDVEELAESTEE